MHLSCWRCAQRQAHVIRQHYHTADNCAVLPSDLACCIAPSNQQGNLCLAGNKYDAVIASEVIEHVIDPAGFCRSLANLTRDGGTLVVSTLARTARAYALAIIGAEYTAGLVPEGTHDWNKFLTPGEWGMMLCCLRIPWLLLLVCSHRSRHWNDKDGCCTSKLRDNRFGLMIYPCMSLMILPAVHVLHKSMQPAYIATCSAASSFTWLCMTMLTIF